MNAFAAVTGTIAFILLLYTFYTAWFHPHLRKMAFRNVRLHKTTSILTITGSAVGTALITSALLLQTSITHSMDQFFEEQFGNISADIPAVGQKKLNHPYFDEQDLVRLQDEAKKTGTYDKLLPTVGFYGTLIKLNSEGKPLLVQPQVYIHCFDAKLAGQFDDKAMKFMPADLTANEVILSDRAAVQLEVKQGDAVQLRIPNQKPLMLIVKKVVPEQGLTGYRGDKKGTATAILPLDTARSVLGMKDGYNHILASSQAHNIGLGDWEQSLVRMIAESDLNGILKFTPFFFIASLNAIVIGIVLVLNIFKMIADERKQELGVLRAVGMDRRDLARVLRLEGMIYALGSGVIGIAAGTGISYLALRPLADKFSLYAHYESQIVMKYEFDLAPGALISGFAIGVLLIYFSMVWVSRKVAKVPIVELLHELNKPKPTRLLKRNQTTFRNALSLVFCSVFIAIVVLTPQISFQKWLSQY
ncbi:MAG: FtsX-like permease family protein, partial [Thermoactinomyces sp.]